MTAQPGITDKNDPLLLEINGDKPIVGLGGVKLHPTTGDHPVEPEADLSAQLEVGRMADPRAPRPTTTPRMVATDKTHSVQAGGNGYLITVEGDYIAKNPTGTGKVHKPYKLNFKLPSLTNSKGEGPLGIILGLSKETSLMQEALRRLDPPGIGIRTYFVTGVTCLTAATPMPTNIQFMNIDALRRLAKDFELPIDPDDYWDVNHLREDIIELRTNTGADEINPKTKEVVKKGGASLALERIQTRMSERKEQRELLMMNQDTVGVNALDGFE